MIAWRFLAVTESVWSKLRTRLTVAVDTPTAFAISLSVTNRHPERRVRALRLAKTQPVGNKYLLAQVATAGVSSRARSVWTKRRSSIQATTAVAISTR